MKSERSTTLTAVQFRTLAQKCANVIDFTFGLRSQREMYESYLAGNPTPTAAKILDHCQDEVVQFESINYLAHRADIDALNRNGKANKVNEHSEREESILNAIKTNNHCMSMKEIAEAVELSIVSTTVHVRRLIERGYLRAEKVRMISGVSYNQYLIVEKERKQNDQ